MAYTSIKATDTTYIVTKNDTFSDIANQCILVGMSGYAGLSLYNAGINKLKSFNPDITNINRIHVGQKIILRGTAATKTVNRTQTAKITAFGLQTKTDKTIFATWAWDNSHTDHYETVWKYGTGDGVAFIGERSTTTDKQSVYSGAPENANCVLFQVKPVSTTYKKGDKDVHYWTAGWSTVKKYYFKDNPPGETGIPNIEGTGTNTLTAKLTNLDINATQVQFQIYDITNGKVYKTGNATIKATDAIYSCTVKAGMKYKVRSRGVRGKIYGEWSDYSEEFVGPDVAIGNITNLIALSGTSVEVQWKYDSKHKIFDIAYTTEKDDFESNPNGVTITTIGSASNPHTVGRTVIEGLTAGQEYFFRICGRSTDNSDAKKVWSSIASITIGVPPTSPTTWSSVSTASVGELITFNWTHNSVDGSRQTEATVHLTFNDVAEHTYRIISGTCETKSDTNIKEIIIPEFVASDLVDKGVIRVYMTYANLQESPQLRINNSIGPYPIVFDENVGSCVWNAGATVLFEYNVASNNWIIRNNNVGTNTGSYEFDTSELEDGAIIKWQVETAGVLKDSSGSYVYSPRSVERIVKVYAQPSLEVSSEQLTLDENPDDDGDIPKLNSLPLVLDISEGSQSEIQKPIGYHVTITANSGYETIDNVGNEMTINAGQAVYDRYFDSDTNPYQVVISAGDLSLENGVAYTVVVSVSMDSGLTAEQSTPFEVSWADANFWPNAQIIYNSDTYTTSIMPYCWDEHDDLIENIKLAVYRREFDGTFTEIESDLNNVDSPIVTDPHPALDYARYRIVATSENTGTITYYDVPGEPIGETAAIIQWDENWTTYNNVMLVDSLTGLEYSDVNAEPAWTGSLVRLPYNIDVNDTYSVEVEHVPYIGRDYPVAYYGTQKSHAQNWNVEIPATDVETLYALRRLAIYRGNVYVREPSGSGYWASVTVSFDQNHCELTIPITISITRVEGGA